MEIEILGPFDYLPFKKEGASLYCEKLTWKPGIYFWAYQIENSYWVNYIGISSVSIAKRQSNHLSSFLSGGYDIYNINSLFNGVLERAYSPGDGNESFNKNFGYLEQQLDNLCFFFAPIETETSLLQRIETSFITHIRSSAENSKILDNGIVSRYKRDDEEVIPLTINSPAIIKGIPDSLLA
ncbi:hypothetical protein [uncultured Shewanella sp.]|uniref:hypothetical protein n=1 Tax=uncultured Shewanella sp. TaxID=173975 RepID=UPI002631FEF7|nr:hypothetical protein [uncultured Shewanella sp.]